MIEYQQKDHAMFEQMSTEKPTKLEPILTEIDTTLSNNDQQKTTLRLYRY